MDPTTVDAPGAPPAVVFGRSSKKRKAYRQRGGEPRADEPVATRPADADETTSLERPPAGGARTSKEERGAASDGEVARNDRQKNADRGDEGRNEEADDGERVVERDNDEHADNDDDDGGGGGGGENDAVGIAVAELIRRRKARKPKIGGVAFRDEDGQPASPSQPPRLGDGDWDDMDLDFAADPMAMGVQFVPQTGMIGQLVNKHMEEYVEAQLAKRHQAEAEQGRREGDAGAGSGAGAGLASGAGAGPSALSTESRKQLAMKGKLHEIDLGAEARARNVAMTERATQRLYGAGDSSDAAEKGAADKVRLGRDGQPLGRKRRDSDDIKRDQLVEQFLHENKMDVDVYDVHRETAASMSEERPTDDRIAEQFRREFMEAVAQRMRRKRKPLGPPTKPKARNEEEILRGPKLGGSRNVRSVMRDKLLQKQEEERHNMPKYELQLQEQKRRLNRRR